MLNTLAVSNYRSLRNLTISLGQLTVLTGPNGSGKSNVYRALRLLADKQVPECLSIQLDKELGETKVIGQDVLDLPAWKWLSR
jgi:predicted ATPase